MIPESKAFMANVRKLVTQPAQPAKKTTKS